MVSIRQRSNRQHGHDDGSGRIALIGLVVVLALLVGAIVFVA